MERSLKFFAIFLSFFFFIQSANCDNNIYFINSDETNYVDDEVICKGNVIIMYEGRIISAEEVTYNQKNENVIAKGKVILKDEEQNVYFFDSLVVHKNFESGEGKNIKVIMQDRSRLAANKCILKHGNFELENAIYTPCYECLAFDELTWQAKASQVYLDLEDTIDYENLTLEMLGNSVFYLPYLSVPSPKVKRKNGFLAPKFSISSKRGFSFLPQYFINISEQQELILKPIITQRIGSVGWLYYGSRFENGEFNIDASITGTKSVKDAGQNSLNKEETDKILKSGYRGHIFSNFRYEIDEIWRCSSSVNLASDRYYLKRFPFLQNNDRVLESNALLEGFDDRNYTIVKTSIFQTNMAGDEAPKALPVIERNFSTDLFDGTLNIDAMLMNLLFNHGREAKKAASNISWNKEFIAPYGNLFELKILATLKALNVNEKTKTNYDSFFEATPQVSLAWKWPLLLSSDLVDAVFTPIIGIIAAGNKKHTDIFEEQFSEINDINFLEGGKSLSQYNIDYGSRICYGAKISAYKKDGENLAYFTIGRTTDITDIANKPEATGMKYKNSNIVTALDLFFTDELMFTSSANYSTRTKEWLRFRYGIRATYKYFDTDFMIFKGRQCSYNPFFVQEQDLGKEEEYKGSMFDFGLKPTKNLRLKGGLVFGSDKNKLIKHSVGMEYQNECTNIDMTVEQTKYRTGDLKPETAFWFIITLKNLG